MSPRSRTAAIDVSRRLGLAVLWGLVAAALLSPGMGHSADDFPNGPIDLHIGSNPAGSTDGMGRVLARALGEALGQPVVVHNTPGAGGAVMASQLKVAPADGYTLGMTISHAYTGNPVVMPDSTSYAVADFTHLASVSKGQCALVTNADQPYRNFDDLIAAARRGEAPVFASQSPLTRILADYIASVAGVRFRIITVQGGGETMQAILGRHADFGFSGGPHIDFVASSQMRVLASAEDSRLPTSPDVPTLRELGYDISSCALFVVSAPSGLPAPVADTLASALEQAIASPDMRALIRNLKLPEFYLGPGAVTRALEEEAAVLTRATAALNEAVSAEGELSARFMPYVAGSLVVLSVIMMLVLRLLPETAAQPAEPGLPANWVFAGVASGVLGIAFALMTVFGYLPGTMALVAGFMLLGRTDWKVTLACSAMLPIALWLIFSRLLGYPLP